MNITSKLPDSIKANLRVYLDNIALERKSYYNNLQNIPTKETADEVIKKYTYYSTGVSGVAGLLPAFLGFASVLPEAMMIMRNQFVMIYDLCVIYGYKDEITTEHLVLLYYYSQRNEDFKYLVENEDNLLSTETNEDTIYKIIVEISKQISIRVGRSLVCRWIPVLGATALSLFTYLFSMKTGGYIKKYLDYKYELSGNEEQVLAIEEKAIEKTESDLLDEIFPIIIEEDSNFSLSKEVETTENKATIIPTSYNNTVEELKIMALITLMKQDDKIHELELSYVEKLLSYSTIDKEKKDHLKQYLESKDVFDIDFSRFKSYRSDGFALIVDMIALAKRDENLHPKEKEYIQKAAEQIGIYKDNLEDLFKR